MPYVAGSFFNLSGMSFGAISKPAVLALSRGAREAGIWMNTGEGGLSPYHLEGGADIVFQIGTAKYGVRNRDGSLSDDKLREIAAHDQVRMFEVKLAQGAKPGKGGILPGAKITPEIAAIRGINEGEDSISPNRHVEVASAEELLDFIAHVRDVTGKPVGIKTVFGSDAAFRELFDLILQRGLDSAPDFITLDGGEGGTGASPLPLMDLMGVTIREALPEVANLLREYGLKERIRLISSGKLMVPGDVAWAPTGITTHDPRFQKGLVPEDKCKKVARYAKGIVKEVELISHSVGVSEPRKLRREHVRIVQDSGQSVPMDVLYPVREAAG